METVTAEMWVQSSLSKERREASQSFTQQIFLSTYYRLDRQCAKYLGYISKENKDLKSFGAGIAEEANR